MSNRERFISALNVLKGNGENTIDRAGISKICDELEIPIPQWFVNDPNNRVERGVYSLANIVPMKKHEPVLSENKMESKLDSITTVRTDMEKQNLVPEVYKNYVPFGEYSTILKIVKSNKFFPVFISGHSGNGKTMSVEQACAAAKRKFILVSMTPETDESDLLGNYILLNGEMIWRDGPVTVAAREGAVLCIDEIDYGAQNLSSLQRVLEGKPFLLKKKGEIVTPADGFTIFATANTKGKGSDDGRYMFTNILNEAFLERFKITIEQIWPVKKIEKSILEKEMDSMGCLDEDFCEKLIAWAEIVRKTFEEGGCDEVISTRRLVHIVESFSIFKNRKKAIQLCLNRFDDDTKISFVDLYSKIDSEIDTTKIVPLGVDDEPSGKSSYNEGQSKYMEVEF